MATPSYLERRARGAQGQDADRDPQRCQHELRPPGGEAQRLELWQRLERERLPVVDMTRKEMAKLHVRFMVGGRAAAEQERLLRFEFPERPGALMQFLTAIGGR